MGIRAFLGAVQTRLPEILDPLGVKVPVFDLGWKSTLMQHGAPPQIVWVPRGGPTKGDALGGNDVDKGRRLGRREVAVDAHIWCEGIDECEAMTQHLIVVFQDVAWGAYRVVGEVWDSGDETEFTRDGQLVVVTFEIHMPWVRRLSPATRGAVTLDVHPSDPMRGT